MLHIHLNNKDQTKHPINKDQTKHPIKLTLILHIYDKKHR